MGRMSLHATEQPRRHAGVTVEEYKRPKFKVEVEAPKDAVQAQRHREGARQGDAVQRRAGRRGEGDLPRHPRGALPRLVLRVLLVAAGAAAAGAGDRARRRARPSRTAASPSRSSRSRTSTVPEKDEPSFRYTVTADVTDTTGETRTGSKSVNVGYVALRATVDVRRVARSSDKESEVRDHHDHARRRGAGREGHAEDSRAEAAREGRPRRTSTADTARGSAPARRRTRSRCPTRASRMSWELGDVVFTTDFATNGNGKADVERPSSPAGIYRAVARNDRQVRQEGHRAVPVHGA